MNFRQACEEDIPAIVKLLKLSLGETDLPLSEEIWRYKHLTNPFGTSIVFVAEEAGNIVGIRAFMQWEWQLLSERYSSLRSVDAATAPLYQRRGIFRRLTMEAIEFSRKNGKNFIFNTPNDKSLPGNLQLGWKTVDKIEVSLKPTFSFLGLIHNSIQNYEVKISSEDALDLLCRRWNKKMESSNKLFVPKSREYLLWRYEQNLIQQYEVFSNHLLYLAAYIKDRKGIKELRVSECIFSEDPASKVELLKILKSISSKLKAHVVSFSPHTLSLPGLKINGNYGPKLVVKKLNLGSTEENEFLHLKNWNYSLGDLELF